MKTGFPGRGRKGFVLAAILLAGTMLVTVSVAFAWFARLQLTGVLGERQDLQSRSLAFVGAYYAARGLVMDKNGYDSQEESWFQPLVFPLPGVQVVFHLQPQDHKIPLNNLFLPDGETFRTELNRPWQKLWRDLEKEDLTWKVLDFLDPDATPRLSGREGPGNLDRPLGDMSELLLCPGVSPEILEQLKTYCTLWGGRTINANTITPEVYALLDEDLTEEAGKDFEKWRRDHPLKSLGDLEKFSGFPESALPRLMGLLGVESTFFRLEIQLTWNNQWISRYEAVLRKDGERVELVFWRDLYE
jgi:type II secretory pathway component PulK